MFFTVPNTFLLDVVNNIGFRYPTPDKKRSFSYPRTSKRSGKSAFQDKQDQDEFERIVQMLQNKEMWYYLYYKVHAMLSKINGDFFYTFLQNNEYWFSYLSIPDSPTLYVSPTLCSLIGAKSRQMLVLRPFYGQIILRSNILRHHFFLPKVIIKVQNGNGVLSRLVPCLECMKVAWWILQLTLDLYYYLR